MNIYIAVITHRHGEDVFASSSPAGLERQVASYCRTWWAEAYPGVDVPIDDERAVEMYFEDHPRRERLETYETILDGQGNPQNHNQE